MKTKNDWDERRAKIEIEKRVRREELETAWLRGFRACEHYGTSTPREKFAEDYAERVVGGSTRPAKPNPLPTPSKDENAAENA